MRRFSKQFLTIFIQIDDIQPSHAMACGRDGQIVNFERKVTSAVQFQASGRLFTQREQSAGRGWGLPAGC